MHVNNWDPETYVWILKEWNWNVKDLQKRKHIGLWSDVLFLLERCFLMWCYNRNREKCVENCDEKWEKCVTSALQ